MIYRKRNNPSKCNDKSFSASTSKGACTWHQGVEKEVTRADYDKSRRRVRHGSPKGFDGKFAPPIGKVGGKRKPVSKPKTVSIPKPKPVEQTKVEPTFEQCTLAQMKSLVRGGVRSVFGKMYPRGAKSAMLNAHYATGFDDSVYPFAYNAVASDVLNWIAEGFFGEQEEQKLDKAYMDNWVQSFVSKIPAELEKEQLELLEDDKKALKSKFYDDFGSFLVSPYFNSDVIHSVRKYMEKDNTGVVLPPSIKSIKECSFDAFEKIKDAGDTGNKTDIDNLHSVVSFDLGSDYIFNLYCRLDGTTKNNLVWKITFNLRQTQVSKGRKGFTDAFECYTVTVEPKLFNKAIAFLKDVAIVIYNLLMLLDTPKDSDWYDFASKLFDPKFVGNHGLFNFVNNLLLDADKLLVKTPKEDKDTIYRVKGTKWVIQKKNKALSLYNKADNQFLTNHQFHDTTLSKFACLYLLNVTNSFKDGGKMQVDVRGVIHKFDVPPSIKNFEYRAPYLKIDKSRNVNRKAISTKLTIFMADILSKDFSLMVLNIYGKETGMGTVFRDPPLKWGKTRIGIAIDRNKYWSVVPDDDIFTVKVSEVLSLDESVDSITYDDLLNSFSISDLLNLMLVDSIYEKRYATMGKAKDYKSIDKMMLVSSAVGLSIGSSDFLLSKSKKALELATEYIKMLPEDTQRVFINRRKMIEKSSELMVGINQYNSERVKGNWVVQLRQALSKL
tara:strand:- start:2414 stop:4579 length:2166 start_codon:yes stop_codon:yes gene_type:complete